jgi:CPA1 family monovalent cation:H+ antiporter
MALFESMLILALLAIVMLQVSRRLAIPYPTMLALAGVLVAALPWAPDLAIDPQLALTLFIAPALVEAAYDMPLRTLRRYWSPLLALAAGAVLLTTAAVAWLGMAWAGLPLAAAIALGAIVAPPDAAAAAAMLSRLTLPRSTIKVLTGESLLNDAVALLIFAAAVGAAMAPRATGIGAWLSPQLAYAVPGGVLLGFAIGRLYVSQAHHLSGTLGGTLAEFVSMFGAWVLAEKLHLSAILAVVVYGMTVAHHMSSRQSARDRVHSYSVWAAAVFFLNVLAFLLLGLQARAIVLRLDRAQFGQALVFAALVLAMVIGVRIVWVMLYSRAAHYLRRRSNQPASPSLAQSIVASWCGMRGLVTLATALALPARFPSRDVIVLSALAVVLGTLIVQGFTLGPLVRRLRFTQDDGLSDHLVQVRHQLLQAALTRLESVDEPAAELLRREYREELTNSARGESTQTDTRLDQLRRLGLMAKRDHLLHLRSEGAIDDDAFRTLENELDWAELAATPTERLEIMEG